MKLYSIENVERIIGQYCEGGEVHQIHEGTLGHGTMVLAQDGYKTVVIQEIYLNCWSSGHTVRMYNEMPEKYKKLINEL